MSDTQPTSAAAHLATVHFDNLVVARLAEFFDHRTPWNRGLWQIGAVLGLEEVIEYGEIVEAGQPPAGLTYACESMNRICRTDPGLGAASVADEICSHLVGDKPKLRQTRAAIGQLTRRCRTDYLVRWAAALAGDPRDRPTVELTARRLAAHLLDAGFSGDHLHGWLKKTTLSNDEPPPLAELVRQAHAMLLEGERSLDVLVPLSHTPRGVTSVAEPDGTLADGLMYLDQQTTLAWIEEAGSTMPERPAGALLIEVEARDPWSAVERAAELVARVAARLAVGSAATSGLRTTGDAWVSGKSEPIALEQPRRQVRVPALQGHGVMYRAVPYELADPLDDALELLAAMEEGTTGASITNGWAAIEGLLKLKERNDPAPNAADRLADITACSLPVAELLRLARIHESTGRDTLAAELAAARNARGRVNVLGMAMSAGATPAIGAPADIAACHRVQRLLADPVGELSRIRRYIAESFRRLYNQRNLVMHSGSFRSVALRTTLRTAPTLVAAGFDRIVHEQVVTRKREGSATPPLDLHARVEAELNLLGGVDAKPLWQLLD